MQDLPDPHAQPGFYAGTPTERLIAWFIDVGFIFLATVIAGFLTVGIGFIFFFALFTIISLVYRTMTLTSGSATWGMRIMGMKIRDQRGQKLEFGTAALHTFGTFLCFTTGIQIVSILFMLFSERKQGLPDLFLGTVALNKAAKF